MKSISLISLLILFSLNYAEEVSLTQFVEKFLSKINQELSKKIGESKSFGKIDTLYSITFDILTEDNFKAVVEKPDLIYLKITDFKAKAEARMKTKISFVPIEIKGEGEVKTNVDAKLKIETKDLDGKNVTTATIIDLKTDTDLILVFDKFKINVFDGVFDFLKKLIEQQVLDRFLQKELQKIVNKNIDKFL